MDWTVAIGVDTHRDQHVAVAVDQLGRRLGALALTADEAGFALLERFALGLGEPAFVVEGTGSYGASLTRALITNGFAVYECDRPERRRSTDKNDLTDAERAARRLIAGQRLALPRTGAERQRLRLLLLERRSCQQSRTQAINQLRAGLVTLDPQLRAKLAPLSLNALTRSLARRRQTELSALRRLAKRIELLAAELAEIDTELDELTRELHPSLRNEHGIGPVFAAQILVSSADPRRLRSEASFAALAGVSPIEASSGPIKRHRLNRGGDRQLNWALHTAALNRIRHHDETASYYQRLLDRGKTKREAIRCVKRVLARRLYRTLTANAAT